METEPKKGVTYLCIKVEELLVATVLEPTTLFGLILIPAGQNYFCLLSILWWDKVVLSHRDGG